MSGCGSAVIAARWRRWVRYNAGVHPHPMLRGRAASGAAALAVPVALTAVLQSVAHGNERNYVYLYLAVVAVLGVANGLTAALVAAGASFLLVDYLFVVPVHTFQFAEPTDL